MPRCILCDKDKPDDYFYPLSCKRKDGRVIGIACMQCDDEGSLLFVPCNRKGELRRQSLARAYKLSEKQFNRRWSKQGGRCAICRSWPISRPLNVDHCHKTGKVRGLLCTRCNVKLGKWRDNPPAHETRFIQYLSA